MHVVEVVGVVGEIIGWVGLIAGVPLALIAVLIRSAQGTHRPTPVTILEDFEDNAVALWTVGDRTHTRYLSPDEVRHLLALPTPSGFVSDRHPEQMRLDARAPSERACTTIAIVMLGAAVVGFAASVLPLFWS
ncbi:MAG: hypothetical protein P0Y60_00760 [Candidatus Microbacterium colombiense]|nr:MAG: hypothetical protein P0Y60_00760 [Microbacterium sp.]